MYEMLNRPNINDLIGSMPRSESGAIGPEGMMPWLIELFGAWDEGRNEAITAVRAEIAACVSEQCEMPLCSDIAAGGPPLPRGERGEWLLRLAIAVLAARMLRGSSLADDCRRFLAHAHAWVQGV